ncbi:MAG: hypothetical protein FH756_04880 [Firmicutes bacterium]|nr:hypothetical protein [Bacillota bacterium]
MKSIIKENTPPRNLTEEKLTALIEYIEFTQDFFDQLRNVSADVSTGYAINSTISASNDIIISGQGCFSSN